MNELQFADDVLARIRARGGRYDERGYLFVLASIEYLQSRLTARRHVTGAELAWACRDFAREQFGLLARTVLAHWGITRTEDFGRIVFTLVEVGLLVTQPGDREDDFDGVYDFATAFGDVYGWERRARAPDRGDGSGTREGPWTTSEWPACHKCSQGTLIPLSDYGRDGAPITYKAWVCTNPECGFNLRIDNGEISFGRAIGQSHK